LPLPPALLSRHRLPLPPPFLTIPPALLPRRFRVANHRRTEHSEYEHRGPDSNPSLGASATHLRPPCCVEAVAVPLPQQAALIRNHRPTAPRRKRAAVCAALTRS